MFTVVSGACAAHKCVYGRGRLVCNKNPAAAASAAVRIWDRDGIGFFSTFDPPDLMAYAKPDANGFFSLRGCGDDFDWLPGVKNNPDPYLEVVHRCNGEEQTMHYDQPVVFLPESMDFSQIILDN
ncbi:unnamed protein product [Soboliphyme baturini]|uniref:Transthyretin-like family protein n=1 Tax=Soboliphyme baturini TaxID=241478 RepID=A0A3P8DG10_9BILA|nr:unnamed protein product [Soboliphyme baturini]